MIAKFEADCCEVGTQLSLTAIVGVKFPAVVGLPLRTPAGDSPRPGGVEIPLGGMPQVYGGIPPVP